MKETLKDILSYIWNEYGLRFVSVVFIFLGMVIINYNSIFAFVAGIIVGMFGWIIQFNWYPYTDKPDSDQESAI